MRPKYLETYHLTDFEKYCSNKCINIVVKHNDYDFYTITYYRGLYGGYLYGKKVAKYLKSRNKRITNIELYKHFKYQKNFNSTSRGMYEALYDILNYWSGDT